MSTLPTTPSLAEFDELQLATLDPAAWSANLAALAVQEPALAEELRAAVLPDHWRPAIAVDGFTTFRIEEPGAPAAWLGQTAAPLTRARSRLGAFDPAGKNPALPTCGAGAELDYLLTRLPAHVAVFVFEADLRVVAAVLHTHDWSAAIGAGRCIFVPPDHEYSFLTTLMATCPGLLPPGEILLPDLAPATRIAELRALGERLHRETSERRNMALAELGGPRGLLASPSTTAALSPTATPRLALLALRPQPLAIRAAECLARAADRLGWPALHRATTAPHSVHPLAHCRALAEFRPDVTIYAGGPTPRLPLTVPGPNCVWLLDELDSRAELPDDSTLYLAASPTIAAGARRSGVREENLLDWYWGCEAAPAVSAPSAPAAAILVVADLPDPRPETCGIQRSTHQKLWAQLGTVVAQAWETPRILEPAKLLVHAEHRCQVEIRDPAMRESLLRLIERVLIPAVALEHIIYVVAAADFEVLSVGRGWERALEAHVRPLAASLFELPHGSGDSCPSACIWGGWHDLLHPALLHAAACGWPLLIHAPGGRSLTAALGSVLRPQQHLEPFADRSGLRRCLESLRTRPEVWRARAEKARLHVLQHHTYERRLQDLRKDLRRRVSP